ncbi:P-loop containing nucleoside triphosphate hydrolase protein [Mycena amicta]|nr:P-loop containing nucleoside triphosphate hydrolase protein [Mycena amicta]
MPDKVPYFNAPIYLQNKSVIGKVDEILGPINEVYFSVKMGDGMVANSFKKGDKVYIGGDKLLPIDRFLPKPKVAGGVTSEGNVDAGEAQAEAADGQHFNQEEVRGVEEGVSVVGEALETVEGVLLEVALAAAAKGVVAEVEAGSTSLSQTTTCLSGSQAHKAQAATSTERLQTRRASPSPLHSTRNANYSQYSSIVNSALRPLSARDKLLYAVEKHGVVILVGQTGCGKTTQLPQYLMEAGWAQNGNVIACTQPRRVAATSVASRVANEVGSILGDELCNPTLIHGQDGMLFRETLVDPLLSRYSVIMIDEAHERSIYTDLLLGVLKKIRRKRPSLRLILSSATLDATSFLDYFTASTSPDDATIVSLEGRMYPVEVAYLDAPTPDYVRTAAEVVWNINLQQGPGDILVFLTGRDDIMRCIEELSELLPTFVIRLPRSATRLVPLALHAGLSTDEQLHVFEPAQRGTRKAIIATNIAEIRIYNPTTALASLATVPTSLASATQRAGRAGRTSPGVCYRLYPKSVLDSLLLSTPPEITRTDMTTPILQLKSLGIDDLMKFEWVSAPPAESVLRALEGLVAAGMIGTDGRLTVMGEQVAECPVEVGIARMLFNSKEQTCGEEILTIAAMTAVQDVFIIPEGAPGALAELERRKFTAEEGDHLTLLNAYNAFTRSGRSSGWCKSHALSFRAMSRAGFHSCPIEKESCEGDAARLRRCLVSGYWRNGARWVADGTYRSVRGNRTLHVHPTSVLFTRKPRSGWVVFHEMEETTKTQIRVLSEIEPDWLLDHGHKFEKGRP